MRVVGPLLLLFVLLACVSSGQAIRLSGLRTTRDLDDARFRSRGAAVLGFVGPIDGVEPLDRDKLDYPVYSALRTFHPAWPLVGAKTARAGLSQTTDLGKVELLLGEARTAELPYDLLQRASRGKGLLTIAMLLSNEVVKTDAESDDEITYCTTRAIAVRYRIFDLERRTVAWEGVIRQDAQRCNSNPRSNSAADAKGPGGFFGALIGDALANTISDAAWGTYPAAPSLVDVARKAAFDFARVLPDAGQEEQQAQ